MSTGTFALIFALVALALIAAYLMVRPGDNSRSRTLERRREPADRRHSSTPVAYERRRGVVDRRLGPPATLPAG